MFATPNGFQRLSFFQVRRLLSRSANKNVHPILNDPDGSCVSSRRLSCSFQDVCWAHLRFLFLSNQAGGCSSLLRVNSADVGVQVATVPAAHEIAGESEDINCSLEVATVLAENEIAGESEELTALLDVDSVLAANATAGDKSLDCLRWTLSWQRMRLRVTNHWIA